MTTQQALLDTILANPDDDTARLVYADWLDENEASVTCEMCGGSGDDGGHAWDRGMVGVCNRCDGSGFVSNGYAAKSEFIRVQCELATFDDAYYLSFDNRKMCEKSEVPLIKRSAELLHKAWAMSLIDMQMRDVTVFNAWVFRRGFVESVSCPWDAWRDYGDAILAAHPVRKVTLTSYPYTQESSGSINEDRAELRGMPETSASATLLQDWCDKQPGQLRNLPPWQRVMIALLAARWPSVREWVLPPEPRVVGEFMGYPVVMRRRREDSPEPPPTR